MCCPPRVMSDGLFFLNTQGLLVRCCQEIVFFAFFFWFLVLQGKAGQSKGTVELAITGPTWMRDSGNVKGGAVLPPSQLFCSQLGLSLAKPAPHFLFYL